MQNQLYESLLAFPESEFSAAPTTIASAEENEIYFRSDGVLTLGVEVELQLMDATHYNLCSRAEEVLEATTHLGKVKPEFYLSTIEINTDKCYSVQHVEEDLYKTFTDLQPVTKELNLLLSTTGSHPFSKYSDWIISPTARYQELIDRNQWLTRRMSVFGLHIHLGMSSGEDCIRFNNFLCIFTSFASIIFKFSFLARN
ncbi:carboxylate-amine ligase [Legionella tunisiensis]|uniref:carboxylate-amine ligase n=1 Tax=Legionella tunisiensis TaxID=1034944 RepID=UPI00031C192A|nr:glutamate-cysteine ligase family protein [Legionella tunisiensis]